MDASSALQEAPGHIRTKPILLYISSPGLVRPSTFQLLVQRANFDAFLQSFLDAAFGAVESESHAVEQYVTTKAMKTSWATSNKNGSALLDRLVSEQPEDDAFLLLKVTLTTITILSIALSSRDDHREAMRSEFPAIFDPEASLAIQVLRSTDVSNSLDLITKGIEAIRLAYWLDFFLVKSMASNSTLRRALIRTDQETQSQVLELVTSTGWAVDECLHGLVLGLRSDKDLFDVRTALSGHDKSQVNWLNGLPMLAAESAAEFQANLVQIVQERHIDIVLIMPDISLPFETSAKSLGSLRVNFEPLLLRGDAGRTLSHLQNCIEAAQDASRRSVIYGPGLHMLTFGDASFDPVFARLKCSLESAKLMPMTTDLRNALYAKDGQRYGDEPVSLSAVKGNPCQQIAIIGMSCRVPGADDPDALWKLLEEGKDMCRQIPETLYRYEDYHSSSYRERNVMRVSTGNFLESPHFFDRNLLGSMTSGEDCRQMDPQQRVTLLTAFEVLQQAGYGFSAFKRPKDAKQWSSHLAYCSDDYREHLSQDIRPNFVANTHRAHLVARVNQAFGFEGNACTYDTACSSALVAIEAACNSLVAGETGAALTGGINILTQPQITIGLDRGFFLSPSSQCLTLDDAGAGYSRADAVSLMLLKRLPDAIRDGDPILALISSAATNHSGESFSITHPHGPTQRRLYGSGMLSSNAVPADVSYIEMHGTGTQSGDLEEVTGIVEAFGPERRPNSAPLVLGSVKANIGHSEATSGASSLVKTVKIYEHGIVPRHVGIRTVLNSKLPSLEGFHVPMSPTKLTNVDTGIALVDNFSAAGGNSSIMLEPASRFQNRPHLLSSAGEGASVANSFCKDRPLLLLVSASSPFSLDAKRRRLIAFLDSHPNVDLEAFCSGVSLSDAMHSYRLLASPSTIDSVRSCLRGQESVYVDEAASSSSLGQSVSMSVGIVFSGQGSQYLDMGRELYEGSPAFRSYVDRCSAICGTLGLPNPSEVISPCPQNAIFNAASPSAAGQDSRSADNYTPVQYQLAMISVEVSLASMLIGWGIKPTCVVGHSLGEYAALWLAGALSLRDLLHFVGTRALLMMELCEPNASSMLAVRAGVEQVEQLIGHSELMGLGLEIACINSPTDTVVAGRTQGIENLRVMCDRMEPKIKAMAIPVPYAFHSAAVDPLMDRYRQFLQGKQLGAIQTPLASNVKGRVLPKGSRDVNGEYLVQHVRQPVRFADSITDLQTQMSDGVELWIEAGPHPTCVPMLKGCYADRTRQPDFLPSFRRGISSWQATVDLIIALASRRIQLDWSKVFADLGVPSSAGKLSGQLPLYPFDLEGYWVEFKDRGLRDHLIPNRDTAESNPTAGTKPKQVRDKIAAPEKRTLAKPEHSLLSQCIALDVSPPTARFVAKVNQSPFRDFIEGHIILGVPLTPATVFVELAQEAGSYWCKAVRESGETRTSSADVTIEVSNLSMVASLYRNQYDPQQGLEVILRGDPESSEGATIEFASYSSVRSQQHQYGACRIRAVPLREIETEWGKLSHLVQTAARAVLADSDSILRRETIYKRFEAIVLYLDGFRGMNTIWLNCEAGEAVSEVLYHPKAIGGKFVCSPMLLDSLGGLTGFISNVAFAEGNWIYMAENIGRVVVMPRLTFVTPGTTTAVRVYARMQQRDDLSTGSSYFFFEDGTLLGVMEGIVFKRIRRDVLGRLVKMASRTAADEAKRVAEQSSEPQKSTPKSTQPPLAPAPGLRIQHKDRETAIGGVKLAPRARNVPETASEHLAKLGHQSHAGAVSVMEPRHLAGPALRQFDQDSCLFLFPDGTGVASSYPRPSTEAAIPIYGFDSPYLGRVEDWSRGVSELIERYVEMLVRLQPRGPYRLAGWSIGGVIALEVARQLLTSGQRVAFVGLIDTPYASQIRPLSAKTLESMLDRIKPSSVREHFRSCALSLPGYRSLRFESAAAKPDTVAIFSATDNTAMEGLMASEQDWRAFWSASARLEFRKIYGDHWTCVRPALDAIVEMLK
ncbi:hypothetical protein BCV70DRAFT_220814 [Testicularia cyperi]|uniref:Ketoacyl-synt-domain-containing protein n=1 Tax=Testicularia cyperi TaxID=1882483 RepID=A0A317XJ90_9BASI|nr:hypothetical protein BCV70DRAFT_220814 [Testicularia cyperi]